MSLKFSDALRLSLSNIVEHKKRSAITVLTISVLFGFVMGLNFLVGGLKETLLNASAQSTGGAAYVQVWYNDNSSSTAWSESITDVDQITDEMLTPKIKERSEQKLQEWLAQHNGEMVGATWYYQLEYPYRVISLSAIEDFMDVDLSNIPEGKVPVILPEGGWEAPAGMPEFAERIDGTFYQVGTYPSLEPGSVNLPGFNILNPILAMVGGGWDDFYLVDDGSGLVQKYMKEQMKLYLEHHPNPYISARAPSMELVARFANAQDLVGYMTPTTDDVTAGWFPYGAHDLFSNTALIVASFRTTEMLLTALNVVILIIAIIVATLTFAHLIDQDAATVALYRSLGATTSNIYLIYFLYLLELCGLAVITCIIIAFGMSGFVALTSAGALGLSLQEYYHLSVAPPVNLFVFDNEFWMIILAILVIAPISLGFTVRRFSAKHIAKKLKEE